MKHPSEHAMTDTDAQLATLRAIRDSTTDATTRAQLDAAIAAVEAATSSHRHIQHISDHAQVGVAVAGDVHGHIFLAGQRGKTATELLEAYLRRVAQHCA